METVLFWILAVVAVSGGLAMVSLRSPLSGAFSLVFSLVSLAALYAMLHAEFVFILQVLVYAGAIMVLIIFTIMLLNLDERDLHELPVSKPRLIVMGAVCSVLAIGFIRIFRHIPGSAAGIHEGFGSIEGVGRMMLGKYLYGFEVISLILLVAVVGVVLLARKKI